MTPSFLIRHLLMEVPWAELVECWETPSVEQKDNEIVLETFWVFQVGTTFIYAVDGMFVSPPNSNVNS